MFNAGGIAWAQPTNASWVRDITTFLHATNGDLKVVQATLDEDFDTTGLCENLKTELKDRHESFKSCIIHVSLLGGHKVNMRHILYDPGNTMLSMYFSKYVWRQEYSYIRSLALDCY